MTNKDKLVKMSSEDIAKELCNLLNNIRDKYQDKGFILNEDYIEEYKEWLDTEIEMTADEMFKKLGYRKNEDNHYIYYCQYDLDNACYEITIDKHKYIITHELKLSKLAVATTEAELKAINKKIEELKGGK